MAELRCVCRWAQALGGQWTGVQAWPELLLLLSSRVEVGAAWVVFAEVHIEVAAQLSLWFPSRFLSSLSPEATVGMLPRRTCPVLWVTHRSSRPSHRQGAG